MLNFIGNQLILPTSEGLVRMRTFHLETADFGLLGNIASLQDVPLLRIMGLSPVLNREFSYDDLPDVLDEYVNRASKAAQLIHKCFSTNLTGFGFIHP